MRTLISILFCLSVSLAIGTEKVTSFAVSPKVVELLESYCFSCHDAESKKGDVRLDNLETLALKDRLDLLNRVQEQIFIKEMPPKKKKTQPSDTERKLSGFPRRAQMTCESISALTEQLAHVMVSINLKNGGKKREKLVNFSRYYPSLKAVVGGE